MAETLKQSGAFEQRIGKVLSGLYDKKVKLPEKVVYISFARLQEKISKDEINWRKFIRNTLADDLEHYKLLMTLSRRLFISELITFVETTLSNRKKQRERDLKNGR